MKKMNQLKFILLAITIFSLALLIGIGCKRDYKNPIKTTKELQENEYFKNYVKAFIDYSESITNDDWGLSSPQVKQAWANSKKNHSLDSLTKKLVNKKGQSYYSKRIKLLQAYTNVYVQLIKPGIITKELFDETIALSIKYN